MSIAAHDPRCWGTTGTWSDERCEDAIARALPFGQRFFAELFKHRPELRSMGRFLRWSVQPDDVYGIFDRPGDGAGVQLDAALEYVIVWGAEGIPTEYGDWGADQVAPAIAHVLRLLPPGAEEPRQERPSDSVDQ